MDFVSKDFNLLGRIALLILSFQLLRRVIPWLYFNLIGPTFVGPKIDVLRMGSWAVVTGATDGIGKSYAKALARKGVNLVLISRSSTKLKSVAKEIGDANNVKIEIVEVNFANDPKIYDKIRKCIEDLDVGVLVNNVGMSYSHPDFFLDYCDKNAAFLRDIVSINIQSVTHMCQLVLPRMLAKRRGVIINISSTAAVIPNPLLTVYSATKAFVDKFSVDLQTEYQAKGITVQSVQPGFVATNMSRIRRTSILTPSADVYVDSALRTLGITGQTTGYFPHALMQFIIKATASIFGDNFARNIVFKNLLTLRQRALRNLANH